MGAELLHYIDTSPFKDNKDSFIFYSAQTDHPLMYSQVYENFNKTMKALGIARKSLTIHSYRHTYSSFLQDESFSDADMLYLTRHNDIKQVLRYSSHITPVKEQKKRQAAEIIDSLA
ncbi:tyrosine-type recombinase/integrase [Treponema socranskii]|uniref:tyrosine-type recombinase/integrase n=1 Tax=Treponema socranskii TaxID=53419 RepID=UPI003D8E2CEA